MKKTNNGKKEDEIRCNGI